VNLEYPWYNMVEGDDLEQGDIVENCPVFIVPDDLPTSLSGIEKVFKEANFDIRDVIVMSQSCDLAKGHEKISNVLLCSIWSKMVIAEKFKSKKEESNWWENARNGRMSRFHILNKFNNVSNKKDFRVVDFGETYTLPLKYFRNLASQEKHLRLLPPYREHLSQAFARFFMRVGLPVNIPPFK